MNNTIPTAYQNIFEAMFACVEDQTQVATMSVAQVVDYLDANGWDDLLEFLDDPRVFQQTVDSATRDGVIEVCNTYPHYNYAELLVEAEADALAFLAEFSTEETA